MQIKHKRVINIVGTCKLIYFHLWPALFNLVDFLHWTHFKCKCTFRTCRCQRSAVSNAAGGGGCLCTGCHWSVLPYRTNKTASATPQTVTWRTFQVLSLCLQNTLHMFHQEHEQWLWHWDRQNQVTYSVFPVKKTQGGSYPMSLQPAEWEVFLNIIA